MSERWYKTDSLYDSSGKEEGLVINERYYNRLKHFDAWLAAHSSSYPEPAEDLEREYHKFFARESFTLPEAFDPAINYQRVANELSYPLWEMKHLESCFDNHKLAQEYRWCLDDFNSEEDE